MSDLNQQVEDELVSQFTPEMEAGAVGGVADILKSVDPSDYIDFALKCFRDGKFNGKDKKHVVELITKLFDKYAKDRGDSGLVLTFIRSQIPNLVDLGFSKFS